MVFEGHVKIRHWVSTVERGSAHYHVAHPMGSSRFKKLVGNSQRKNSRARLVKLLFCILRYSQTSDVHPMVFCPSMCEIQCALVAEEHI